MIKKFHALTWVKIVIVLGIWWAVYLSWPDSIQNLHFPFISAKIWGVLLFLGILNWVLEWLKWHRLASPHSPGNRTTRLKEVSRGFLLGQGVPFGDWIGRMTGWPQKFRSHGWALNAYASSWQTAATAGGALIFCPVFFPDSPWIWIVPVYLVYLGLHFYTHLLSWKGQAFPPVRSWEIGLYSFARHAILSLQAVGLTLAWGYDFPFWTLFAAWQWIWVGKMIGGLLNVWGEMGTRQWSGVFFLGLVGIEAGNATLLIWVLWILNNSIPLLMGSIYWIRSWKSSISLP